MNQFNHLAMMLSLAEYLPSEYLLLAALGHLISAHYVSRSNSPRLVTKALLVQ
jgi:hypothetical protein